MTGDHDHDHEAAVRAAQSLLAGPTITVRRSTWRAVITLLREAARLMQEVLAEADAGGQPGSGSAEDHPRAE